MTLADYLSQNGITHGQFAERIGCKQPTVTRFVKCRRRPSPDLMKAIADCTKGAVTANDFYEIAA